MAYKIRFQGYQNLIGDFNVIFGEGPGMFAGKEGEFWVMERALRKLDEKKIPYEILVGKERYHPAESVSL